MGDLRLPDGAILEDSSPLPSSSSSSSSSSSVGPIPYVNIPELWAREEQATQEIIRQVQPTVVSEERRRDVIDYVQRLLKASLGCEVFPFGSVPLKTYLPDGDIDLTAFCGFNFEEGFANDVYYVLEAEDHNPAAEFVVKGVQYIRAEVKLVKCLVQNIVVDISFNQIGGLCALCFLEEVNGLIGKDHLFKRSIILIKAWCYYESRILGAHHGLISTYALETLVLYIFHLFHSSLNGPLAVIYRFLDYFSKFDWDNFCVSLSGPVHLSSLPEILAERPENGGCDLLLTDEFIREYVKKFSVPSKGSETNSRTFIQKHLNIVDPLKENNNLGRSVSKGNFFRIRSAFSFGARKLGQILLQPQENMAEEVRKFFTNTLDRHGQGQRPDVQDFLLLSGCNGFVPEVSLSGAEPCREQSYPDEVASVISNEQSSENSIQSGTYFEGADIQHQIGLKKSIHSTISSEVEIPDDEISSSPSRLSGDANDLATREIRDLRITNYDEEPSPSMTEERQATLGSFIPHEPRLFPSRPFEKGKVGNGELGEERPADSSLTEEQEKSQLCQNYDLLTSINADSRYSSILTDTFCSQESFSHETRNLLPDLSGDVDGYLNSLRYSRWWYDHVLTMPVQPVHFPPLFQRSNQWDAVQQPVHFRQDMVPHLNINGGVPRPAFFPMNPPAVPGASFGVDEMPKARGTGTYFPNTNHLSYRDRFSLAKGGRNQGPLKSPRTNGQAPLKSPGRQGVGKPQSSDPHGSSPRGKVFKDVNGFLHTSDKAVEFVALGHPPLEASLAERASNWPPDSSSAAGSQNGESHDRLAVKSYRLKDDEEFPPLSI